jgi:hypothetical protein
MTFWDPCVAFRTFAKNTEWTFEMRKPALAISLAKPTYNAETIPKNCELVIYLITVFMTLLI